MYNPLITISQSIHLRASWGIYQVLVSHTQITSYFLIFVQLYQRVCHLRSECVPILPLLWSFSQHWILFLSCLWVDEYPNGDINSLYDPFQLIWIVLLALGLLVWALPLISLIPIATKYLTSSTGHQHSCSVLAHWPLSFESLLSESLRFWKMVIWVCSIWIWHNSV